MCEVDLLKQYDSPSNSKPNIDTDKRIYGKHNNVYLTDEEVNIVATKMMAKYLIDEVSEWKLNNPSDHKNRDFDLIKQFKENQDKRYL